jgi:uncharacterized damage-inducible protein DinB
MAAGVTASGPLSEADRAKLVRDLEGSRQKFLDAIADVTTEAQWSYKPAPDRWSVAECAAHIVAAEEFFRQSVRDAMKSPPLPTEQQSDARDSTISAMVRNRSNRFQAPAQLEPAGKVMPKAQTIAAFEATRAETLQYVRTTQDALREHGTGVPPNTMTAYQGILMLSGHTERHTAQLLEVKASPGYPR